MRRKRPINRQPNVVFEIVFTYTVQSTFLISNNSWAGLRVKCYMFSRHNTNAVISAVPDTAIKIHTGFYYNILSHQSIYCPKIIFHNFFLCDDTVVKETMNTLIPHIYPPNNFIAIEHRFFNLSKDVGCDQWQWLVHSDIVVNVGQSFQDEGHINLEH